jgi:hypothetical protein
MDEFAASLLEEAKRFLEKAGSCDNDSEGNANLHAALLLAFCSLDAHLNAIAMDFERRKEFEPHERSIMFECEVYLENGRFVTKKDKLKMWRLEERIQFLHRRLSNKPIDKQAQWWSDLAAAIALRNELTHPKKVTPVSVKTVSRAVQAVVDTLNALYLAVYKRGFPVASRGLLSDLDF